MQGAGDRAPRVSGYMAKITKARKNRLTAAKHFENLNKRVPQAKRYRFGWVNNPVAYEVDVFLDDKILSVWNHAHCLWSSVTLTNTFSKLPDFDNFKYKKLLVAMAGESGCGGHASDIANLMKLSWSNPRGGDWS